MVEAVAPLADEGGLVLLGEGLGVVSKDVGQPSQGAQPLGQFRMDGPVDGGHEVDGLGDVFEGLPHLAHVDGLLTSLEELLGIRGGRLKWEVVKGGGTVLHCGASSPGTGRRHQIR